MEIINNKSENLTPNSLCTRTILKKLGDAITYAGNVNWALIKCRTEALKPCLPAGVQKQGQTPDFCGKLFGNKLQQQMKYLNEHSKLGPQKMGPQRQSPYSHGPYGQSRQGQSNYQAPKTLEGLLGSHKILNETTIFHAFVFTTYNPSMMCHTPLVPPFSPMCIS